MQYPQESPEASEAVRKAFDFALKRKALATEAAAMQRITILSGRYPEAGFGIGKIGASGNQNFPVNL